MLQEMHHDAQTEAMPSQMCNSANNEVIGDNATGNISLSCISGISYFDADTKTAELQ